VKESIFGYFSENLGLFRFVTKQFCLFRFRYRFETPKQTEIFSFWFHETNRNKPKTDLVSVCFCSNRNLFLFVSRTPYPKLSFIGCSEHHLLDVQSMMTLGRMACATDATMTEVCTCNDMDNCNAGPSLNIHYFFQVKHFLSAQNRFTKVKDRPLLL
jgi:hypothetical protein